MKIEEFFKETSTYSLNRVMSAATVLVGLLLALVSVFIDRRLDTLVAILLTAGFGGKVTQKIIEKR